MYYIIIYAIVLKGHFCYYLFCHVKAGNGVIMKLVKCLLIIVIMALAAGLGFYLCSDAKEVEKKEAAVMI